MSFIETLWNNLETAGQKTLLVEIHAGKSPPTVPWTGAALLDLAQRARGFLDAAGINAGDRVALLGPNSARWIALDVAIMAHGAVVVPLYSRQAPSELAVMVKDAGASLVIAADAALLSGLQEALGAPGAVGSERRSALYDEVFGTAPNTTRPAPITAEATVTIIYTSGSTGIPKGVELSAANVDFMLPTTEGALGRIVKGADRDHVFHFLPFCFAGSRIMLWTQLRRRNLLMISTDLTKLVDELKAANPSYYLNVPAVLERIRLGVGKVLRDRGGIGLSLYEKGLAADVALRAGTGGLADKLALAAARRFVFPQIKATIGSRLDFLVCGSAPLSPETQRWFELLEIPVFQVYGLTETTAIVTMDQPDTAEPGKVGVAIPGVELRLGDGDELLTRGPHIFKGYWKNPEATAEVIQDGWFHTGDQAEIDARGNLRIVGRVKNLMKPESGHWIAPEPIEEALRDALPTIEHAVVVGHGRPFLVVLVTGAVSDAEVQTALDAVNATLPHYKKVKRFHRSAETLTPESGLLTANAKLKRRAIEQHFKAALQNVYGGGAT